MREILMGFMLTRVGGYKKQAKTASVDVQKLLENAHSHYDDSHRKTWLGQGIAKDKVQEYTDRMIDFLTKIEVTVDWEPNDRGSFAFSRPFKYHGNKRFGEEWTWGGKCKVWVQKNFFSDLTSRGERAMSVLHELTHYALATYDYGYLGTNLRRTDNLDESQRSQVTKEFYGGDYCTELASDHPEIAYKNAENWGYYFCSYHNGLGWDSKDQKYLTASECEKIRGQRFS